jgi:hypothetical protein
VNKYCRAREAADYNIIMRMHITSYTTKVTDTHSQYIVPTVSRIKVQEKLCCFCEILQEKFLKQTKLYIAFVDLMKALDNVNWIVIMEILKMIKIDYRDRIIFIRELYEHQMTSTV